MSYLLPPFSSTYHEIYSPKSPGGEASRGHSGWCRMWGGGKMPKPNFWRWSFQISLFCSKSPFGGEKSYATCLGSPSKCSPFWGSQCTSATRTKSENQGDHSTHCWWTKSCTTNHDDYPIIYRVLNHRCEKKPTRTTWSIDERRCGLLFFFPPQIWRILFGDNFFPREKHGVPMKKVGCNNKYKKLSVQWPK